MSCQTKKTIVCRANSGKGLHEGALGEGDVVGQVVSEGGRVTNLTNGSYRANAFSVFVAGSNVYTAGCEDNGINTIAKVWKNGKELYALTDGSNSAQANFFF